MKTLISYPRSGAHWLMSLVDTYLGSDKKVDWQHLHDVRFYQWWEMPHLLSGEVENPEDGTLKPTFRTSDLILDGFKPVVADSSLQIARGEDHPFEFNEFIFLYREDLSSHTYSFLRNLQCSLTKESILRSITCYKTYMAEWQSFISNYDKPVLVLSYENMLNDTKGALFNVIEFLGFDKSPVDQFDTGVVDKQKVYQDVHEGEQAESRVVTESEFNNGGNRALPVVRYDKKYIEQKESFINEFGDYIDSLQGDLPEFDLLRSTRSILI
jgi:hypothetical protein